MRTYPLLLGSGALLSLAFPEPDIAPLAWIAFVPLLVFTREAPLRRAALAGMVFALGFFGALLVWVSMIGWVAWAILIVLQALFVAAFSIAWATATRRLPSLARVVVAGALWVTFEYLRSIVPLGGFTWGQLAQSQHSLLWMLRPAALGGGWLVAFLVMSVNALLAEAVQARSWRAAAATGGAALILVLAPLLLPAQDATGDAIDVSIVQGNVPTEIPRGFERDLAILASHRDLTVDLAAADPDVVIWPESSIGFDLDSNPEATEAVETAVAAVDAPLIAGGNLDAGLEHYMVMAFQIDPPDGRVVDRYQKTHLVPFGEYVPGRSFLDWIPMLDQVPRDALPGEDVAVFDVAGGRLAPVISFEGDFGSLVRRRMDEGGRMLTVLTNTSTWGETWASAQHVAFSKVRAAENGVWVVHAALSGVSAFIAPDGRVVRDIPLWTAASATQEVRFAEDITFYARYGDWVPLVSALMSAVALGYARRRRQDDVA